MQFAISLKRLLWSSFPEVPTSHFTRCKFLLLITVLLWLHFFIYLFLYWKQVQVTNGNALMHKKLKMMQLWSDSLIAGLNVNQSGLSFIQNTCSNTQVQPLTALIASHLRGRRGGRRSCSCTRSSMHSLVRTWLQRHFCLAVPRTFMTEEKKKKLHEDAVTSADKRSREQTSHSFIHSLVYPSCHPFIPPLAETKGCCCCVYVQCLWVFLPGPVCCGLREPVRSNKV